MNRTHEIIWWCLTVGLIALVPECVCGAIIAQYPFTGDSLASTDAEPHSVASDFTDGPGLIGNFSTGMQGNPAPARRASYAHINSTSASQAVSLGEYFGFTVTPGPFRVVDLSSLTFDANTGTVGAPQTGTFFVRSSVDGFSSTWGSFTQLSASFIGRSVNLSNAAFQGVAAPLEFRIYMYDAGSSDDTNALRVDNVTLNGTTHLIPDASSPNTIVGLKSDTSESLVHLFMFKSDGSLLGDLGEVKLSGASILADGLARSSTYGLMAFKLSGGNSTLLSIDPETVAATAIGSALTGRDIRGAVFDSSNHLRVIDAANNELLEIDPTTGQIVGAALGLNLGGSAFDVPTATDVAQRPDGTFVLTAGANIYALNITSGELSLLSTDSSQALAGVAFVGNMPDDVFALEINGADDLYRYNANNSFQRSTVFADILSSLNAGRGDLASIVVVPEPSGAATAIVGIAAVAVFLRLRVRFMKNLRR